ncbi:nitrate ABC transporter permease [Deinococcus aquiradiocola]|uniref:Nitrate ABC transporter, permease protein n=1 Tax=Deinococcus aquiradiocola TaxID=393059 RepID=A0A917UQX9_9DEIO|nr:nitrate ABC transporter permease [Deinococcus aquiradiocola]GGJ77344.1 nitrate ABC transporter, permease protein [Deinococcus aquiradiocola]
MTTRPAGRTAQPQPTPPRPAARVPAPVQNALYFLLSLALLVLVWTMLTALRRDLPSPAVIGASLAELFARPWYNDGPNDQGILNLLLSSLTRVFSGFAIGAVIAVPVGILMGSVPVFRRILDPVVQLMRPVSPLAWFPIGLTLMSKAEPATVFIIAITALWPTIINTSFGVSGLPADYRNVARVFNFSPAQYVTRVLLPYALPHIVTGMRISFGIAWMVIVAAEMLSGKSGIGFYAWDAWNAGNLAHVVCAILIIGVTGFLFDQLFNLVQKKVSHA